MTDDTRALAEASAALWRNRARSYRLRCWTGLELWAFWGLGVVTGAILGAVL